MTTAPATGADPIEVFTIDEASDTVLESLQGIWSAFLGHVPLLIAGLLVLAATGVAALIWRRIVRRLLAGLRLRTSLKALIERFAVLGLWFLGVLLAAMVVFPGVDPADAIAALGIGSVAIGLAFKDIFENFFAGILILWRFPFENGDFIVCGDQSGQVVDVTIRNTMIRTVQGELVVLPNATIYKNPVEVLTHETLRRITVICGVAYGADVGTARTVIHKATEECSSVSGDRDVEVFARAFGASSIDFEVTWWTGSTPLDRRRSRDEVVEAIKAALDEAGIEIPFPQRTLTFGEPLPTVAVGDGEG